MHIKFSYSRGIARRNWPFFKTRKNSRWPPPPSRFTKKPRWRLLGTLLISNLDIFNYISWSFQLSTWKKKKKFRIYITQRQIVQYLQTIPFLNRKKPRDYEYYHKMEVGLKICISQAVEPQKHVFSKKNT